MSAPARLPRAVGFAVVAVALAAAAHALGSGGIPGPGTLLVATLATVPLAAALARAERSFGTIAVALLIAQALLHTAFVAAAMPPDLGAPAGEVVRGLLAHLTEGVAGMPAGQHAQMGSGASAGGASVGGLAMVALHIGGGLLSAWWLRRGEAALWAAARATARLLAALAAGVVGWREPVLVVLGGRAVGLPGRGPRRRLCSAMLAVAGPPRGPPARPRAAGPVAA